MHASQMHYFPVTAPFVMLLFFVFGVILALVQLGIIEYAYAKIGIQPRWIFLFLILSLVGQLREYSDRRGPRPTSFRKGHGQRLRHSIRGARHARGVADGDCRQRRGCADSGRTFHLLDVEERPLLQSLIAVAVVTSRRESARAPGARGRHRAHADYPAAAGRRRRALAFEEGRPRSGVHCRQLGDFDRRRSAQPGHRRTSCRRRCSRLAERARLTASF